MSLPRKDQLLFCGNAVSSPSNVIEQFGSLAASAPVASSDPAVIQALVAWLNGWAAATIPVGSPPQPVPALQDFNGVFYVITYQLQYLLDRGIPEYSATTTYGQYSFCQVAGVIYRSNVSPNTGNNPPSSPTQWLNYGTLFDVAGAAAAAQVAAAIDATTKANAAQAAAQAASDPAGTATSAINAIRPQIAAAWVQFSDNGSGGITINGSFNVASVVSLGTGDYLITFTNPLPNANYCTNMSCCQLNDVGATDSLTQLNGDIFSTTQLEVRMLDGATSAGTTSPRMYVSVFCNT
jgi:hypothetical protein